jgi:hypothetical protein
MMIIQDDSSLVCVHDDLFELNVGILIDDGCNQLQDGGKDVI